MLVIMSWNNKSNVHLDDFYGEYKKNHSKSLISKAKYKEVIKDTMDTVFNEMMYNNLEWSCWSRVGDFSIRKRKSKVKINEDGTINTKSLRVDYKATKKLWAEDAESKMNKKLVYHLNKHTNGYNMFVYWSRVYCNIRNHSFYGFKLTRKKSRLLGKTLQERGYELNYNEIR